MMIAIRVNTLKVSIPELIKELESDNIHLTAMPIAETTFMVDTTTTSQLTATEAYQQGHFYIQNLSSQLVSITLDPQPNEEILDLTAAPGSKTTHIAALMNNTGHIVANDISRTRMFKLKAIIERYGITNVSFETMPGERLWMKYHNHFDRTLLDAPCSMLGIKNAPEVTQKEIKKLAKRQQWLLRSAVSATKPGGIIVYSTCTTTREENEDVIEWMKNKDHNIEVLEMKRILADDVYEGFFMAKLRKIS